MAAESYWRFPPATAASTWAKCKARTEEGLQRGTGVNCTQDDPVRDQAVRSCGGAQETHPDHRHCCDCSGMCDSGVEFPPLSRRAPGRQVLRRLATAGLRKGLRHLEQRCGLEASSRKICERLF